MTYSITGPSPELFAGLFALRDARLALPGAAESAIRDLFANPAIATIHAHTAAHGCFAARIDRHGHGVS